MLSIAHLYRVLLWVLSPIVAIYTLAVAIRQGGLDYLKQRFGFALPKLNTHPIWIHCASVGELNTALPLIEAWLKIHDDTIVITTVTPSSAKVLGLHALDKVQHCYAPLDYITSCRRFLRSIRPRCALVMETEIWLNLFAECDQRNIPLYLLNARLSQATMAYSEYLNKYYQHSLAQVNHIYARSQKDADYYMEFGVDRTQINVIGNLKYAGIIRSHSATTEAPLNRQYVLAASTHHDEEITIATALQEADKNCLLVIVPRHPERGKSIRKELRKQGFGPILLRSETQEIDHNTKIYIADTVGELPLWIAYAELVFTGGSLVNKGGHNILEPASLGTVQITGPHTENFDDETRGLLKAKGLTQVENAEALTAVFKDFFAAQEVYQETAHNALRYIEEQDGKQILQRYLSIVEQVSTSKN